MLFKDALKQVQKNEQIKEFEKKGYYMNSGISLLGPGSFNITSWIFTYYNPSEDILNVWHIEPQGDDTSLVTFSIEARVLPPFKQLLGGRLEKQFGKQAEGFINELKIFAETGTPVAKVNPTK